MDKLFFKDHPEIKKDIEALYNSAFPEDERPPFFWYYSVFKKTKDSYIIGYYQENQFIGFIQYVIYQDILYFAYLAISKQFRNQGYGTKILQEIIDEYRDHVKILCFEEVDEKYSNYSERLKRMQLYQRIGFIDNGLKTQEGDVIYQSAYIGKHRVSFDQYIKLFDLVYSEGAHEKYLKCDKEY